MKKKEIYILAALAAAALIALFFLKYPFRREPETIVGIYHGNELVQQFDPARDALYHIQGSYGTLDVEVKDGKWHVINEECPNHICHGMGWASPDDLFPITCLPNEIYILVMETQ